MALRAMRRYRTFLIGSAIALSAAAHANEYSDRGTAIGWRVNQPTRFMVSGVLRQDGTPGVIKPIHSIITASTRDDAVAQFSEAARREYPGYSLISTLASPVPLIGTCEINI